MYTIFKYEKRRKYTHMSVADTAIWERFIEKYPKAYEVVQYDYRVGDPPPFNPLADDGTDLNQDALYRLRIDVVGRNGNNVDIIEIKPKASPSTIGQVKGYMILFKRDEKVKGNVRGLIITDRTDANMEYLCKMEGINILTV